MEEEREKERALLIILQMVFFYFGTVGYRLARNDNGMF